ncbi:MAG: hypothetical protein RIQ99_448 [Pseudomonadota bacterium]|jgi:YVTN family beta-propeller protein
MLNKVGSAAFAACFLMSASNQPAQAHSAPASSEASQYRVVEKIAAADGGWDFAAIEPLTGMLYIARSDAVTAINLTSREVVNHLASAGRGHQVLVLDQGATLFETDGETGLGRFLSASDGSVLAEIPTGKKPDAAFFDPKTGLIAVMNADDGTVALIDPTTRQVIEKIAVGGGLEFAVPDGMGSAYVNIEDANTIVKIDLVARRKTGTIDLTGCEGPTGLALVAGGTRLISACANETAVVVDTAQKTVVAHFAIGKDPDAVLVDETRGRAFIPCGGSGTLVEIAIGNPEAIRPISSIPTQIGAKTGAIDPRDGRIYLPTATLLPPEPGAKRGKPAPGSFVVLVIAPHA